MNETEELKKRVQELENEVSTLTGSMYREFEKVEKWAWFWIINFLIHVTFEVTIPFIQRILQ